MDDLLANEVTPGLQPAAGSRFRTVAPPWHTAVIVVLLLGVSVANIFTLHTPGLHPQHLPRLHPATLHASHLVSYGVTLVWEWALFALVYWGLRMRRTPLRQLLGVRRTGAAEWWTDIAIALGFWFASALALAACSLLLRFAHLDPESIRRAVMRLAPASPAELAFWIALSISAGVCEELIFRGYLQQQFTALTRSAWLGIALSAIFFGLAHGYQGISGVLLITLYGGFFSILAHLRRSLRAGIFAHAWQDTLSGAVLYIGGHLLHRLPH